MINLKNFNPIEQQAIKAALQYPKLIDRELCIRSFYKFFTYFWHIISPEILIDNWHIKYLCNELQVIQERVEKRLSKQYDLIINIPPGTSKTSIVSVMFPVWCWVRDFTERFITAGYSATLALESAELSRDLIRSQLFKELFPELGVKADKDVKSNYRCIKYDKSVKAPNPPPEINGGNRFSTSVGGTLTGFHGHILIVDDPLNPYEAASKQILHTTNQWIDQVLSTRKVDKDVTVTILIMQRINQNDPTGHWLAKKKTNVKHICLPGELGEYEKLLKPVEVRDMYVGGLLDVTRLSRKILNELKTDLGQYGYAGQIGQNPTPPGGGMFKVDNFQIIQSLPAPVQLVGKLVRYWDKAGTADSGAYTVGVKMGKLVSGKFMVLDVKRGRWASEQREQIIRSTAEADGVEVDIWIEQEPGSGGKESAEATIRNLAGYACHKDLPRGDKVYRADPWSVQVNECNVQLFQAEWNYLYTEEHRFFPFGTYKDQVDASSGAFSRLVAKRIARML